MSIYLEYRTPEMGLWPESNREHDVVESEMRPYDHPILSERDFVVNGVGVPSADLKTAQNLHGRGGVSEHHPVRQCRGDS